MRESEPSYCQQPSLLTNYKQTLKMTFQLLIDSVQFDFESIALSA